MGIYLGPIQRVPPGALLEYPGNPRRGDVPAIAESLRVHGQYKPIVVQEGTNHILVGNHTWKAAVSLGWPEIDVIFATVDDEAARKIVLADNRLSDLASYSADDLAALLSELGGDYAGSGYSADDLARLVAPLPPGFAELDPDAEAEPKTVTCPACGHEFTP